MCVSLHSKHTPDLKRKNKRDECVATGGEQQLCTLPLGSVEWLPLCCLCGFLDVLTKHPNILVQLGRDIG